VHLLHWKVGAFGISVRASYHNLFTNHIKFHQTMNFLCEVSDLAFDLVLGGARNDHVDVGAVFNDIEGSKQEGNG
jgi:hypothetical protein